MIVKVQITNILVLKAGATVVPYLIVRFIWQRIPGIKMYVFKVKIGQLRWTL